MSKEDPKHTRFIINHNTIMTYTILVNYALIVIQLLIGSFFEKGLMLDAKITTNLGNIYQTAY